MNHFKLCAVSTIVLALFSTANASDGKHSLCQSPSFSINHIQENDWHFCRAKVKRACVNEAPYADATCARGVVAQTPECKPFSELLNRLNTSADLVTLEKNATYFLISQYFPGDGGNNYLILTPRCEVDLSKISLNQYDHTIRPKDLIRFSKPIGVTSSISELTVHVSYRVQSCKACMVLKSGKLNLQFDGEGNLISVQTGK